MTEAKTHRPGTIRPKARAARVAAVVLGFCCFLCPPLAAQDAGPATRLGKVRVDAGQRRVTFPAVFNLSEGPLEYVLVGSGGKTHESLLRTEVEPVQLHTAMLLLGVKTGEPRPGNVPPTAITSDYLHGAPAPRGDPINVFLRWTVDGKEVRCRAEELINKAETHDTATAGEWTYNGSMFDGNRFLAQEEKSLVALVIDPTALVNNPRPGRDDDQRWSVDQKKVPPKETLVEVTLELRPAPAPAALPTPSGCLLSPKP